jgi:hypothetical protein
MDRLVNQKGPGDNNPRAPFEICKKEINDPEINSGQD